MDRLEQRFSRCDLLRQAEHYLRGLLSQVDRKNSWQLAEATGADTPHGFQRLLGRARWNADDVRDDLQRYVVEHLGDTEGVLIIDETGFLKKGNKSAGVYNGLGHEPFVADVGINHLPAPSCQVQIVYLGDLGVTTGREVIEGEGLLCQPGRARMDRQVTPLRLPSRQRCRQLLARRVTSLVGVVDLADAAQVHRLVELETDLDLPIHLGFVGSCGRCTEANEGIVREHLLQAIANGLLGVLTESLRDDMRRYAEWFQVPLLGEMVGTGDEDLPAGILPGQGTIQRGTEANLLLADPAAGLRLAIVGGMVCSRSGRADWPRCRLSAAARWMM